MTADFCDVTMAFDNYKSNNRFWWCNISSWWQKNILDFGGVTLAFEITNSILDFGDVTSIYDDNTTS